MRIGIDARFLGAANSGLARYSENLLMALARQDTRNQYIVFVNENLRRRLKLGANFKVTPVNGWPLSPSGMFNLWRAIKREHLDLLHVHFPLAPLFVDCPVLTTVHDVLPFTPDQGDLGQRLRPWRWMLTCLFYPWSLKRAKWVVCVSHATRAALSNLFPDLFHKSIVMHSGLDEDFRQPIEPATYGLIRDRLNLPERYILYSGSLRDDKNIPGMLRAFASLIQNHPEHEDLWFLLDISGEDAHLPAIVKLIYQFGLSERVRVLKNVGDEERRVVFENAQLLLVLSRNEGFCFPCWKPSRAICP